MKKYFLLFAVVPTAFAAQAQVSGKTTSSTAEYHYGTPADSIRSRGVGTLEAHPPGGFDELAEEIPDVILPDHDDPTLPAPEDLSEGEFNEQISALNSVASEEGEIPSPEQTNHPEPYWPTDEDLTAAAPSPATETLNLLLRAALFSVLGAPGMAAGVDGGENPEPELWVQVPQSPVVQAEPEAETETFLAPDSETDALSDRYENDEAVGENPDDAFPGSQTNSLGWQVVGESKNRAEVPIQVVLAWLDALARLRMNLSDPNLAVGRMGVRNLAIVVQAGAALYDELGMVRLSAVTVEQRGDDQQVRIFQEENSNSVRIFQSGRGNHAWTLQEADDGAINLVQIGQHNDVRVIQRSNDNGAEVLQVGVRNGAVLTQGSESGAGGNAFRLEQVGVANQFVAEQTGDGNLIEGLAASSRAVQEGDLNLVSVLQSGNENRFFAQQEGTNGRVSASQSGNKNAASVVQQQPTP